ncbi:MAG: carboxypeptidase-like regulatory domain-containing protein [Bacteroidales bacterium]
MKIKSFIACVILLTATPAFSQENYRIDWEYRGNSFEEFVMQVETAYPVRFFYRDEWISNLTFGNYGNKQFLFEILDTLFSGRQIHYYHEKPDRIILTRYYAIKLDGDIPVEELNYIPGLDYSEVAESGAPAGNIVIDLGKGSERDLPGRVTITGYIRNQDTREVVPGVTVYIPKISAGTISNAYGFYSLSIPRGTYSVMFTFIGMKEKIIDLNLYGPGELDVEMRGMLIPLREAVITADKSLTFQRHEAGMEKINITTFRLSPTSLGEADIMKSMLQVTGVQSVGEGSAGFNVRGGSADQNLILLYGAPLYNTSHFFGFFSAVNSDIIKDVTLYKGAIPGKYGGRLSSVLDIAARDGNRREFKGNAGISPVTTHFVVEGPVRKDTLFYLVGGRLTYSDWLLKAIRNPALNNSNAFFTDLNARICYEPDRYNKIDFSAYYSYDSFRFNSDTIYKYKNVITALQWRHYFTSRLFSNLALNNSYYNYDISSLRVPQEAFVLSHRINSTGLKADFTWLPGRNEFNFGADLSAYSVLPGNFLPAGDSSIVISNSIERQKALEAALYFEDKFIVTDYLSINAGIRFVTYLALGPQTVLAYDPFYPRGVSSVTDTLIFGNADNYKTYAGPEIRFSATFRLGVNSSAKLNYNHTRQYLHLLSNTISISPSDIWKLSDYHLKPQSGDQFSAGYYRVLNKHKIEFSAEAYYKRIENMIDFKGGTRLVMNEFIERDLINVNGKAYGLEFLLRKPEGRIRWSLGYTYSRVLIRSTGTFAEERINTGNWFPANFDKPHDLIITFNYLHTRRMSISANYTYSTGRPVTYPVSSYIIGDIVLTHYSDRNKYRIPDYSRLDISFKVSGDLKVRKIAHPHWIFSLYNITGRQNVYSVYFKNEKNAVKGYYLSVFGRPIPSVSFNFDF